MERVYNKIKGFLLKSGNEEIVDACSASGFSSDLVLPKLTEKNIVFGAIDAVRNNQNVVVSLYPETMTIEEANISDYAEHYKWTLTVACKDKSYDILMKMMCRYVRIFRKLFNENYTMDGECDNVIIGETKFFPDCGTQEKTMTGAEVELTIIINKDYEDE